jgi:hypothetical protein
MDWDGERADPPDAPQVGDRQDVELMYEFYTDLRDEVNQSIEFQNQIVIGGGVLIGVAYGLQFSGILDQLTMENPTLRLIIAALPTITLFTIALWIVEQSRMMRAGHYLHFLENKINAELDGVYLTWENWLRDGNTSVYQEAHYVGQIVGYALFLYGLAVLGLILYAVEFLGVSSDTIRTLSFEWNTLAFVYFLLTLGLFLYLARYTYLIIFHEIDEESSFDRFKDWEADYAADVASGFAYQHEIEEVRDARRGGTDDGPG